MIYPLSQETYVPDEILDRILSFLTKKDRESTVRVSSLWMELTLKTSAHDSDIVRIAGEHLNDIRIKKKIEDLIEKKEPVEASHCAWSIKDPLLKKSSIVHIFNALLLSVDSEKIRGEQLIDKVESVIDNLMVIDCKTTQFFMLKYAFVVLTNLEYYPEAMKVAVWIKEMSTYHPKLFSRPNMFSRSYEKPLALITQRLIDTGDLETATEGASLLTNKSSYFSQIFTSYVENEDYENAADFFTETIPPDEEFFSFNHENFLTPSFSALLKMYKRFIAIGDIEEALSVLYYLKKHGSTSALENNGYSGCCTSIIEVLKKNKTYENSLLLCICYDFSEMDKLHFAFMPDKQTRIEKATEIFKKDRSFWRKCEEDYYFDALQEICFMLKRNKEKEEAQRLINSLDFSDRTDLLQTMFGYGHAAKYRYWLSSND